MSVPRKPALRAMVLPKDYLCFVLRALLVIATISFWMFALEVAGRVGRGAVVWWRDH